MRASDAASRASASSGSGGGPDRGVGCCGSSILGGGVCSPGVGCCGGIVGGSGGVIGGCGRVGGCVNAGCSSSGGLGSTVTWILDNGVIASLRLACCNRWHLTKASPGCPLLEKHSRIGQWPLTSRWSLAATAAMMACTRSRTNRLRAMRAVLESGATRAVRQPRAKPSYWVRRKAARKRGSASDESDEDSMRRRSSSLRNAA